VQIDQPTPTRVRAIVSQHQPAYLSGVLRLFPDGIDIRAQAIAEVQRPKELCFLGLNGLTIGGSSTITGNGCAMMSNADIKYNSTPNFVGSDWAVYGVNGCKASAGHCDIGAPHNYNMLPAPNPLQLLDTEAFNSRTGPKTDPCNKGTITNGQTCPSPPTVSPPMLLSPNSAGGVYNDLKVNAGGTVNFAAGTYFFYNATIDFSGTVNGKDVTFVLLGNSKLSISSSANVNLSAPAKNTTSSHLNGVLIDDQATGGVIVNGNGTVKLDGAMYFPNADVSWKGTAKTNTGCSMVIANTLTINGDSYLSTDGCDPKLKEDSRNQVVALVE
jgi:hypothetical protein